MLLLALQRKHFVQIFFGKTVLNKSVLDPEMEPEPELELEPELEPKPEPNLSNGEPEPQ